MGFGTHRVAVLPLKNVGQDPNNEYLADGVSEELIAALSLVPELSVIARTSTTRYKSTQRGIADVGKELDVGTLVDGSVTKEGSRVHIAVELTTIDSQGPRWVKNLDKGLNEISALQIELVQEVARITKLNVAEPSLRRIRTRASENPEAYDNYLRGLFYLNKGPPEALLQAIEFFSQSGKQERGFALGFAGLAAGLLRHGIGQYRRQVGMLP